MKSISCTNLGPLGDVIFYAVRTVLLLVGCKSSAASRPSSDLLDDLIALAGEEEPRCLEVFDRPLRWPLGFWTASGDSLGHLSCGGRLFV